MTEVDGDLLFGLATGGDQVRILSYASEGVPISREDVLAYQSQLVSVRQQSNSQVVKPLIGLLSSLDNSAAFIQSEALNATPVNRVFGLSDEVNAARSVAGVDKGEISRIMSQLQFDLEPVHRAWSTQQQQTAAASDFYNYGLSDKLLREYIEAQIAVRIEKSRRQGVHVVGSSTGHGQHSSSDPWQV